MTKTIVFIHGMYMTPLCWEGWVEYFQNQGYQCLAPAWQGRDKSVETLRNNHPDPIFRKLTLGKVVETYTTVIKSLDEKPILIGHSMGGLVTQLLLQNQMGVAGVAIDFGASPGGIIHQAIIHKIQLAAY